MCKKAFTLVELIIVITILAILGTIAFISFQGYTKSARDSVRINDLKLIEKNLSLYKVQTGEYPLPSQPYDEVTYESKEVWTQGTVGQSVITNLDKLNKVPRDPLTGNEYTYSRLNTKKELQLACVLEGSPVTIFKNEEIKNKNYKDSIFTFNSSYFVPEANAADVKTIATAYVTGDYNGEIAKVNSGSTTYILAVPSIINGDMSLTDIIEVISNKKLVYNGYGNLPSSYTGTIFEMDGGFDYSQTGGIVVYSGSINDLINNEDSRLTLTKNLQNFYSGTILENTGNIKQLVETDIDTSSPTDEAKTLACGTVDFSLGTNTVIDGCGGNLSNLNDIFSEGNEYTKYWDDNPCNQDSISIININPGIDTIPEIIPNDTIYNLEDGNYIITGDGTGGINMGNCSALIGGGDSNIFSQSEPPSLIYGGAGVNNVILSGININGSDNGIGGVHNKITALWQNGISGNQTKNWSIKDITIKKSAYGIYLHNADNNIYKNITIINSGNESLGINRSNKNIISNANIYNGDSSGIGIFTTSYYNILNNIKIFNNDIGCIYGTRGHYTAINNLQCFNNNSRGVSASQSSPWSLNNIYIYNNNFGGFSNGNLDDSLTNNIYSYSNSNYGISGTKNIIYYGYMNSFSNSSGEIDYSLGLTLTQGSGGTLGFNDGILNTTGTFNSDWETIPTTSSGTWINGIKGVQNIEFDGTETYTYGVNIGKQTRPIRYNSINGEREYYGIDGVDYDSSKFIGEW